MSRIFPQITRHGQQQIQVYEYTDMNVYPSLCQLEPSSKQCSIIQSLSTIASPLVPVQCYNFIPIKQCRICLQTSQQSNKQLLKLCKCMGSVEFIHTDCFKMWLEKSFGTKSKQEKLKFIKSKRIECQMCKYQVRVEFQQSKILCSFQRFKINLQNKAFVFTILLLIFVIAISACIISVQKLITDGAKFTKNDNQFQQTLLLMCSIVVTIILILISTFFIKMTIGKIYEKCEDLNQTKKMGLGNSIQNPDTVENNKNKLSLKNNSIINQSHFYQQIPLDHSNMLRNSTESLQSINQKIKINTIKKSSKITPVNYNTSHEDKVKITLKTLALNEFKLVNK